jgi:two-component system, LuxR family, sensor kinase FixL
MSVQSAALKHGREGEEPLLSGQDIHDGLGQQLTGATMLAEVLRDKLNQKNIPETEDARRVATLLQKARQQCRQLAHDLHALATEPLVLTSSLEQLARTVTSAGVECLFDCPSPVRLRDQSRNVHLFNIAQEAVNHAIHYGRCRRLKLRLSAPNGFIRLEIRTDGRRWFRQAKREQMGMGLQTMKSRSTAMGGTLKVRSLRPRGTKVVCVVPIARNHRKK